MTSMDSQQFFKTMSRKGGYEVIRLIGDKPIRFTDIKKKIKMSDKQIAHILSELKSLELITNETSEGWKRTELGYDIMMLFNSLRERMRNRITAIGR